MEILIATHNQHKKEEIVQILPLFKVLSLSDFQLNEEIVEDGTTFHENAFIKANYCYNHTNKKSIGDDSGLVIAALNGRPGIFSARYAGNHDFGANIEKVLMEMEGISNRSAYFITVLCLKSEKETLYFEGRIEGDIAEKVMGENGFGYDPIFIPKNQTLSFAQISAEEKNKISHRYLAFQQLLHHFKPIS